MAMVCPQCSGTFDQRLQCPQCGVRLHYQSTPLPAGRSGGGQDHPWQQTPWSRILIGLLLAQGLYYGFQNLCLAGLLAAREQAANDVWDTLYGLVLLQALQGLGLVLGGALAGAGYRQGVLYGAVVGVWNAVISLLLMPGSTQELTAVALYGQPLLQMACGAVGGFLGGIIWKPMPTVAALTSVRRAEPLVPATQASSLLSGPVAWGRVLAGAAVGAGGTMWANVILELVLEASENKLTIDSHLQAQLVTWEITALALLAGGALAGATTGNGIKQGLCVGVGVSTLFVGMRLGTGSVPLQTLLLSVVAALSLGLVGGWFGGQLFPPLLRASRPRGLGPLSA